MGQTWEGGDIAHYAGGGHKVNLLKDAMKKWKDSQDVIIMFVDRYTGLKRKHCYAACYTIRPNPRF